MGYPLYRHVLDHAPAGLGPAERFVLAVIADDANDQTRLSYLGMDLLAHRSGLKPDSVQKALRRLAGLGCELRIPLGTDKAGRPVYAVKGKRSTYRVPEFAARELPAKGGPSSAHPVPQRADDGPSWADHRPPMGGSSSAPNPQSPQDSPQSDAHASPTDDKTTNLDEMTATALAELRSATGRPVSAEWAARVAEGLLAKADAPIRNPVAYVRTAIRNRAATGRAADLLPTFQPGPGLRAVEPAEPAQAPPAPHPPADLAPCGHDWPASDAENCFLCSLESRGDAEEPRPDLTMHHGTGKGTSGQQPPLLTTVSTTGYAAIAATARATVLAKREAARTRTGEPASAADGRPP